jgi:hypothetical protein
LCRARENGWWWRKSKKHSKESLMLPIQALTLAQAGQQVMPMSASTSLRRCDQVTPSS